MPATHTRGRLARQSESTQSIAPSPSLSIRSSQAGSPAEFSRGASVDVGVAVFVAVGVNVGVTVGVAVGATQLPAPSQTFVPENVPITPRQSVWVTLSLQNEPKSRQPRVSFAGTHSFTAIVPQAPVASERLESARSSD